MNRISYNLPNHAHYLTFSCRHRQQLLTDCTLRLKLLESWDEARHIGNFAIWAYVIMPEHVHLLIYPDKENYRMNIIFRLLKEKFTRRVVTYWQEMSTDMIKRIRCSRGQRIIYSFWQEGGGYDRNLHDWSAIQKAIDYIEWNPVRKRLVQKPLDWYWSSAQARAGRDDVPFHVDKINVEGLLK